MKSLRWIASFACALALGPSLASADDAPLADWTRHTVQEGLVKPLADFEGHSFSRARPPPHERRVRALQDTTTLDASGRPFVPFAVDIRFGGGDWREGDIVGCAYTGSGKLYVKRGDSYRPAAFLFGRNEDPAPGVCTAAPPS